jgi:hypothetical protein
MRTEPNHRVEQNRRPASRFRTCSPDLEVYSASLSPSTAAVAHPKRSANMRVVLLLMAIVVFALGCNTSPSAKRSQAVYVLMKEAQMRIPEAERSGICYVHHQQMKKERLHIAYGMPLLKYPNAVQFPFAHRNIQGGCVRVFFVDHPEENSPTYGEAYVCSVCTAAESLWLREHPEPVENQCKNSRTNQVQ